MQHKTLISFINTLDKNTPLPVISAWLRTSTIGDKPDWVKWSNRLADSIDSGFVINSRLSVIKEGNSKLNNDNGKKKNGPPFLSFSTAPFSTCPGMGACESYCYSVKAFRYPTAFYGMLQNTLLTWHKPEMITAAIDKQLARPKYKKLDKVDFRLFVDGDFDSLDSMVFWFDLLKARPKIAAYGYSKSLEIFSNYSMLYTFPVNYKLNISNGSKYDGSMVMDYVKTLPVVRGDFIALNIKLPKTATKQEIKRALLLEGKKQGLRVFPCGSACSDCTPKGHACGLSTFQDIPIAVPMH